jgi:hypothetical protein
VTGQCPACRPAPPGAPAQESEELATLTAVGFARRLAPPFIRAYKTGRTLEEALEAIEAGKVLGNLPPSPLRPAWRAAYDWPWIARRRAFVAGDTRLA